MYIIKKSLKRVNFSMIIFFLITCVAIYNIPISLSQEQQSITTRIDINKESEENKLSKQGNEINSISKSESIEINEENISFWSKLINNSAVLSAVLSAVISSIGAILATGYVNFRLEEKRQKHTEKMQKERNEQELLMMDKKNKQELLMIDRKNEQELLMTDKKNKQEQKMLYLQKKLDVYTKARIDIQEYLINGKIDNYLYAPWVFSVILYCDENTKDAIIKYNNYITESKFRDRCNSLLNEQKCGKLTQIEAEQKAIELIKECTPYLETIDHCLREDIQKIYNDRIK